MKHIILIILVCLGLGSCSSRTKLKDTHTVLSVFTPTEAKDFQSIHDFFTNLICAPTEQNKDNPTGCYEKFVTDTKEWGRTGLSENPTSIQEIDSLIEGFESEIFIEIWDNHDYTTAEGLIIQHIEINNFGKYNDYLQELGNDFGAISDYHNDLLNAGLMSATLVADMLMNGEKYDVSDCRVRVVIAIHYLTMFYQPIPNE